MLDNISAWLDFKAFHLPFFKPILHSFVLEDVRRWTGVESVELTDDEFNQQVYNFQLVTLIGQAGIPVAHVTPHGYFTLQDMLDAVLKTERKTRAKVKWIFEIDNHHIWFEGLLEQSPFTYKIRWGS